MKPVTAFVVVIVILIGGFYLYHGSEEADGLTHSSNDPQTPTEEFKPDFGFFNPFDNTMKVRVSSNTRWFIQIWTSDDSSSDKKRIMEAKRGNYTYTIKNDLISATINRESNYPQPTPEKPFIKLEVLRGNKIIFSSQQTNGVIKWRDEIN